jgi:hypothetical protein
VPCTPVKIGGFTAIVCTRGQRKRRCSHPGCRDWMVVLCDAKLENGKTCNKPLCRRHARHVEGKDLDYCVSHGNEPITAAVAEKNRQGSMDV